MGSRAVLRTLAHPATDSARRATLILLVAALVVLSPTVAWAKFTDKGTGAFPVGTTTLPAPTTMSITGTCASKNSAGSAKVTFPNVALADTYTVVLDPPTGANVTRSITSGTTGTTFTLAKGATGTYGVTVTSVLENWTSVALVRSFSC